MLYYYLSAYAMCLLLRYLQGGGSATNGAFNESFISIDCLFVLIGAAAVFLLAKQKGNISDIGMRKLLVRLNGATLFCYIIHVLILDNLYGRLLQHDFYNFRYPVLASFLLAVLTFIISIVSGMVLKKVKIIKNFV